jgi:hypothetical protein
VSPIPLFIVKNGAEDAARSRSSASLRSATPGCSLICKMWIYAIFNTLIVSKYFMSEVPYEKHRISCTSNLKTPEWTRAQYRKHLTGWALGFKPLFRQCSMTRTSNQLNFHHNDYEYLKFCHKKVLLTEFLLGKNLISRSSFESTHLYLHVTFHVQEYKQVHNRISLHMTLFLAEEGIFGFRTDLLPPPHRHLSLGLPLSLAHTTIQQK